MSTKIIHVLKSDSFEDVMGEFRSSEGSEVIFIIPGSSKFHKKESNFQALQYEARKLDKKITIMGGDEKTKDYADRYNFSFIPDNTNKKDDSSAPVDSEEVLEPEEEITEIEETSAEELNESEEEANEVKEDEIDDSLESEGDEEENDEADYDENADSMDDQIDPINEENINKTPAVASIGAFEQDIVADLVARNNLSDIVSPDPEESRGVNVKSWREKDKNIPMEVIASKDYSDDGENDEMKEQEESKDKLSDQWLGRFYKSKDEESVGNKIKKNKKDGRGSKISRKGLLIFLSVSVAILLFIAYSTFGDAKIIIKPRTQQLNFSLKVSASSKTIGVDTSFNKIPGEYFSVEKTETMTADSTGQKEVSQKARGRITIYNNQDSASQPLVATTRFESSDGLIFRIPSATTVPGATMENGKIKSPGKITVDVIADQPGDKYNIGPAKFTIPGFKGGDKYETFYAESSEGMKGGATGLSKIATEEDIKMLEESLKKKVVSSVLDEFQKKSSELIIIDSLAPEIISKNSSNSAGEATGQITMTMTARVNTVTFRELDIINLLNNYIQKTGDLVLIEKSLNIKYNDPKIDIASETLSFNLALEGKAGTKINTEDVKLRLLGKNEEQIKAIINDINEIETARIILSPFWVKKIPNNPKNINVEIIYE